MATSPNPRREHSSTYFVENRSSGEELIRVRIQDPALTAGMGGVLPEQPDPTVFRRVLDVGCGTGGWLIEAAQTYPTMSQLVGVDISTRMITYARGQAEAQQVNDRVEFRVMDVLSKLEFPDNSLDLINMRLGASFVRIWDWPKLLQEFLRVVQPDGVIRIIDTDLIGESSSPALNCLSDLLVRALHQAGHLFTLEHDGLLDELPRLLHQNGLRNVQKRTCTLEYSPDSVGWQDFYDNMRHIFRTMFPFLQKWLRLPADYDALCQQALNEMQRPDFVARWNLLTVWGNKAIRLNGGDFISYEN